jgi:uncharacterized protein YciI
MAGGRQFLIRLTGPQPHLMDPAVVQAHVAWLRALAEDGRLVVCGLVEDGVSLVVIRAADRAEAVVISETDPFAVTGAYQERKVLRFSPADAGNDYLLGLREAD